MQVPFRWLLPLLFVGLLWTGCSCSNAPESPPGPGPTAEPVPFDSNPGANNGATPTNPIPATPVRPPPMGK